MFDLIVVIVICAVVFNKVKRTKEKGGIKGNNSLPNTTVTTSKQFNLNDRENNMSYGNTNIPRQAGQVLTAKYQEEQAAIREAKEDGNSTTAYLMEKAHEDAREHAREKFEEQKRLYETRGGLAVAERFLDGDMIPQGKKCVSCGYCAAENLVPMMPRTRYSCYFCREPLN